MPKISVIMSVYKEPIEWMQQAIDSILGQTFKDFEFIIVNDNPSRVENTQILTRYINLDNRVRIIVNELNLGLTKSLNKGIVEAKGEYIARMDADDISLPQRLEKQVKFLDNNKEIFACGASAYKIDENEKEIGAYLVECNSIYNRSLLPFKSPLIHPVVMFRKLFKGNPVLYDEFFKYSQDYALWATHALDNIVNINEFLLKYRVTNTQITAFHREEQLYFSRKIQDVAIGNLKCKIRNSDRDIFYRSYYINKLGFRDFIKSINFVRHYVFDNKDNSAIDILMINKFLQGKSNCFLISNLSCFFAIPFLIVSKILCSYYIRKS